MERTGQGKKDKVKTDNLRIGQLYDRAKERQNKGYSEKDRSIMESRTHIVLPSILLEGQRKEDKENKDK